MLQPTTPSTSLFWRRPHVSFSSSGTQDLPRGTVIFLSVNFQKMTLGKYRKKCLMMNPRDLSDCAWSKMTANIISISQSLLESTKKLFSKKKCHFLTMFARDSAQILPEVCRNLKNFARIQNPDASRRIPGASGSIMTHPGRIRNRYQFRRNLHLAMRDRLLAPAAPLGLSLSRSPRRGNATGLPPDRIRNPVDGGVYCSGETASPRSHRIRLCLFQLFSKWQCWLVFGKL